VPDAQRSSVVQASPSSQVVPSARGIVVQPFTGSQRDDAHAPASGHTTGVLTHAPPVQRSAVVQASLSAQSALLRQHPALLWCVQRPRVLSQASMVQALRSSQLGGAPGVHTPARQESVPPQ
jgi:hypothetical protein